MAEKEVKLIISGDSTSAQKAMDQTSKQLVDLNGNALSTSKATDQLGNETTEATEKIKQAGQAVDKTADQLEEMADDAKKASQKTNELGKEAKETQSGLLELGVAVGAIFYKIVKNIDESLDKLKQYQGAMEGLRSTAESYELDVDYVLQAAESLVDDGLMGIEDAATSLKNLLKSGFGLEEAVTLIKRFKDSAAFGRQESLQFGQAVRTATEGIKNGNSILVDNAGVTKNLSVMLREAGYSAQDLMRASDDTGIRMAIFNGILRETESQVGDAEKLALQFAGTQSKLSVETGKLERSIASSLAPALEQIYKILISVVGVITEWINEHPKLTAIIITFTTIFTGLVTVAITFNLLLPKILLGLTALSGPLAPFLIGGAVIAGILALIAGIKAVKEETDSLSTITKDLVSEYETLNEKENKTVEEKERLKEVSKDLAELYPDAVEGINNETNALILNTKAVRENELAKDKARLTKYIDQLKKDIAHYNKLVEESRNKDATVTNDRIQLLKNLIKHSEEFMKKPKFFELDEGQQDKLRTELELYKTELAELQESLELHNDQWKAFAFAAEDATAKLSLAEEQLVDLNNALMSGDFDSYFDKWNAPTVTTKGKGGNSEDESKPNGKTPFENAMDDYNKKLSEGFFKSYEAEIEYLNIIKSLHAEKWSERAKVEDQIFSLAIENYKLLSEQEKWTAEEKLANLDKIVKGYAVSTSQIREYEAMVADLQERAINENYKNAMESYQEEIAMGKKTAEQKLKIFQETMKQYGIVMGDNEAAMKQFEQLQISLAEERLEKQKNSSEFEKKIEDELLQYKYQGKELELVLLKAWYDEQMQYAIEHNAKIAGITDLYWAKLLEIEDKYLKEEEAKRQEEEQKRISEEQERLSFEKSISDELLQYKYSGRDLELKRLEASYNEQLAKASEIGANKVELEELYREKTKEINNKYDKQELDQKELKEQKEKQLQDRIKAYEFENKKITLEQYLEHLKKRLKATEEHTDQWFYYTNLIKTEEEKQEKEEEDRLKRRLERWKRFFSEVQSLISQISSGIDISADWKGDRGKKEWISGMSDQYTQNLSGVASNMIGKFADIFLPGIGGIVETGLNYMFDLFSEDNWEERLDSQLTSFEEGAERFTHLLMKVLENLPFILPKLGKVFGEFVLNLILEVFEYVINKLVDFINWLGGWAGINIDPVDWGYNDDYTDPRGSDDGGDDGSDGDQGQKVTYGNITGPLADRLDLLVETLSGWNSEMLVEKLEQIKLNLPNWAQLSGLMDGIRNPIADIRSDIRLIRESLQSFKSPQINGETQAAKSEKNVYIGRVELQKDQYQSKTIEEFFFDLLISGS